MATHERTRYQKFESETIDRSRLNKAPYNPRIITDKARAKLKKLISTAGLLQPLVWNKRTGNLVRGHQRLAILDSLEGREDYSVTVAVVDLDEAQEREQNIALNNSEVQGEWDLDKLEGMFAEGVMRVDNTGFDSSTLLKFFGAIPGEEISATPDDLERVAAAIDTAKKIRKNLSNKKGDPFGDDVNFYWVIVGGSDAQRLALGEALGLEDNRYQDMKVLGRILGLLTSKGATKEEMIEWAAGLHDDDCDVVFLDPVAARDALEKDEGDEPE